ncbi:hypothetical protein EDI_093230 [Entamoeba dispar SAW760]|uniref:Uncharacterized protein n=1 Tax=Entamoeba dispar (strain ATCC PRA-260 / SAW760) TaxID=370354 RepID=B0EDB5_ENTDS|nr:uncharacterized protein EDI_093230 [Entamoeba dispar SAW760]EDR27532.1 hypothetical protein EDI_093230 [Entamoeba dispar SAW760]|eukprot:EDR27532.1 hypothetical protein EDI_093230 [Entamoeba dispar SAW760]
MASKEDITSDDTTIEDPTIFQYQKNEEVLTNSEKRKEVLEETLITSLKIGMKFHEAINDSQIKEVVKGFVPNCVTLFPSLMTSEDEFERCRVLFITRIDQVYENKYTLVVVYAFNLGILLNRFFKLWCLRKGNWEENYQRHILAIQKWTSKLKIVLSPEFTQFLNYIIQSDISREFDFINEFKKVKTYFVWNESTKNKWFINLCLTFH